ncbi:MAG: hypothetical protein LUE99_08335 [Bacteroides sp.]|nr:hypothetical protein [Bacteroides sp.]
MEEGVQYTETDENGIFSFYTEKSDAVRVRFEVPNALQSVKDTILETKKKDYLITLNIELEEE